MVFDDGGIAVGFSTAGAAVVAGLEAIVTFGKVFGAGTFVATEEDSVQILQPNAVFTVANVETAGWKNSKELSPETLPDATSVWYGFYQQRDVEVRVYESQGAAIASGQGIADVATGRRKPAPFASGGISSTRTSYSAYAIVGNLILLCEIKIEDCQGLIVGIE